jgi:hypothetical protein
LASTSPLVGVGLSGVVVAVEGPGRSGVGQDLPWGLCVASGMAGVPRQTDAVQGGGPWIAVLAGQAGGVPGPPQHRCARARPGPRAPQSSRAGRRGRGAGRGRWSEKPVPERDQGDDPASIRRAFRIPTRRLLLSTIAGWLDHGCSIGCLLPAADVRSAWFLPSCSALEQVTIPIGTGTSRDCQRQRQGRYQATSTHVGQVGRAALRSTRSWCRPLEPAAEQDTTQMPPSRWRPTFTRDGSRRRAAELAWTVRDSICI